MNKNLNEDCQDITADDWQLDFAHIFLCKADFWFIHKCWNIFSARVSVGKKVWLKLVRPLIKVLEQPLWDTAWKERANQTRRSFSVGNGSQTAC